jgi:hypothetical protein
MHIGVGGFSDDSESDPFIILNAVLDQPIMAGPVSGVKREDMQLQSVLGALAHSGVISHRFEVKPGEDPPDRYLVHGGREWGVELTELTVQDIRRELADVRRFGRRLQERLRARRADYPHLRGRIVSLGMLNAAMPKRQEQLLSDIESALQQDLGYVGEGLDLSRGMPSQLNGRGIYGDHGGFHVIVNPALPGDTVDDITVSAFSQSQIHRSEAIAALGKRVEEKDLECNEVLIITCGLVDNYGYTCPADESIFALLMAAGQEGVSILPQKPNHIRGLLIHQWNSLLLLHWESGNDLPWINKES